jgi:radical SAM PhpK family P-methyltransferase
VKLPIFTGGAQLDLPEAEGLDCVVVGFNDIDFNERAVRARETERDSAYYADIKLNSILLGGKRLSYVDVLNRALGEVRGKDPQLNTFRQPNLAVCYLTSFLRRRRFAVEMVNLVSCERERFVELLSQKPRAVAITTTFYVEPEPITSVVELIRAHAPDTKIIVGGPYIFRICAAYDETTQDYLLSMLGADLYICDSQGESALAALLAALRAKRPLAEVPNLIWTRDGKTFQRTPRIVESNDLDANVVDWSLFDPGYLAPTVYLRTARSCSFACSFCSYPAQGGEHTVNEVEVIVAQLRRVRELGVGQVVFVDDTFNVPLPRFKRLLRRMIEERLDLRWTSFFRCSNADDETFELMARSGCFGVFLGIESGDPGVLGNMDKHARVDRYRYGIERLNQNGICTYASLIVGFPGESQASVDNTIELIQSARPTMYFPNLYYHDTRAPIHEQRADFGLRGSGYSWSHATMDWREAAVATHRMYQEIDQSLLCGGYSLSFWGIFYLIGQGFSMPQIAAYLRRTKEMVLEGWHEREATGFSQLVEDLR